MLCETIENPADRTKKGEHMMKRFVVLLLGFILLFTYQNRILRYSLLTAVLILGFVFRARVKAAVGDLVQVRKSRKKK